MLNSTKIYVNRLHGLLSVQLFTLVRKIDSSLRDGRVWTFAEILRWLWPGYKKIGPVFLTRDLSFLLWMDKKEYLWNNFFFEKNAKGFMISSKIKILDIFSFKVCPNETSCEMCDNAKLIMQNTSMRFIHGHFRLILNLRQTLVAWITRFNERCQDTHVFLLNIRLPSFDLFSLLCFVWTRVFSWP